MLKNLLKECLSLGPYPELNQPDCSKENQDKLKQLINHDIPNEIISIINDDNFIELRIKERNEARKKGDYEKADAIRRLLEYDGGVILEDKEDGQTTWKHK